MASRRSVLVVDDDEDVRTMVGFVLEDAGFEVQTASNGLDALRVLRGGVDPDVILLDMMMPEMDGWAFRAEQLKDPALAPIPTIVCSAFGSPRATAREIGAHGYLEKPMKIDELVAAIDRVVPPGTGPGGSSG